MEFQPGFTFLIQMCQTGSELKLACKRGFRFLFGTREILPQVQHPDTASWVLSVITACSIHQSSLCFKTVSCMCKIQKKGVGGGGGEGGGRGSGLYSPSLRFIPAKLHCRQPFGTHPLHDTASWVLSNHCMQLSSIITLLQDSLMHVQD